MTYTSAEKQEALRKASRNNLFCFAVNMFYARRGYQWMVARHHALICDALERVFNGETKRLIINIPPRYSKTEIAVVNFIAWAMGRVPDCEFIHASYSATLAVNNSVQIRNLVQHEEYRAIFPDLALASESSHHWKTTVGGVMYATGTGARLPALVRANTARGSAAQSYWTICTRPTKHEARSDGRMLSTGFKIRWNHGRTAPIHRLS